MNMNVLIQGIALSYLLFCDVITDYQWRHNDQAAYLTFFMLFYFKFMNSVTV